MNMEEVMKIEGGFVIEIIKKIREKIGDEYIILLKLNSEDDDPNVSLLKDSLQHVKWLNKLELI